MQIYEHPVFEKFLKTIMDIASKFRLKYNYLYYKTEFAESVEQDLV